MPGESTKALVLLCILSAHGLYAAPIDIEKPEFALRFDLENVEDGGEIRGVPGEALSVSGHVQLDSPVAGARGWSFGFRARGAGVVFDEQTTEGCDGTCLAGLLGLGPGDVFFQHSEVVAPSLGDQGAGVVSSVALRPFPSPAASLPAGISRLLPFELTVLVPEEAQGQPVELDFRGNLVGSRGPVEIDVAVQSMTVHPELHSFQFTVSSVGRFALGFALADVENGGEIRGGPGETVSLAGHVTLDSPVAGVSGWTFGFGVSGAEASIDRQAVEGCDRACLSGLLGLEPDDVFFHTSQVVDPSVGDQGPGVVSAVALRVVPPPAVLPAGVTRLLPFALELRVPEETEGEIELDFRGGLVGSGQPVALGINVQNRDVDTVLRPFRFRVVPSRSVPFRRADCNDDGSVNISDVICMIGWWLTSSGPACLVMADTNGDHAVDISDTVMLLIYLFLGRAPPPEPFFECGLDPSDPGGELGCETPPASCQ